MKTILVIGDTMLDKFSYGRVKRLNPESPAPLILIERTEYKLGGASNVAANIISLWGKSTLVGKIGNDANGRILKNLCQEMDLPFETIVSEIEPTITKERVIETTYNQQLVRVDYENIGIDHTNCIEYIRSIINILSPDLIIISDYQKGFITKSLAEVIMSTGIPVLGDLKPGNLSWFRWALAIKPNFKEFQMQVGISGENTDIYIEMYGPALACSLDTNLIITRSEYGVSVVLKNSEVYHVPTLVQDVFDVTGAGDTFIAAMAVAICEGKTLLEAALFGNKASAVAVGKVGTVTVKREEISI